jgi:hypothetical protein
MFSRGISSNRIVPNPVDKTRAFIPQFHFVALGDFPHGRVNLKRYTKWRLFQPTMNQGFTPV